MTASTEVKIYPKPKKVCKAVAREILKLTQDSPQQRFDIALSGGNTPKKLFKILEKKHKDTIPWDRIHFWWGDERCVPPTSEESNFKMANDFLFTQVPVPPQNIHRVKGENPPEEEAKRYAEEIDSSLTHRGEVPVFDLIILGLGDDGHTASIFPNRLELFEEKRNCVVAQHPASGQNRVTLTGKVLNNASRIFFLVTGENKAMRVSEIMNNDEAAKLLPAYYIEPQNGSLIWFIDEPAASKIT
ncbi:6-phosphogluconolactonase [Mariniphaga anaerophila]|uniref:6-phosphogluconolactonase n=1 Tax=Mariniphaga anaerophila TaxID=1484053 RepID=A0A1M4W6D5_9BACT|nr:6-phosphogluconolactonase [Mariniphaga anaerophila]SHE76831.1 6-phosphogluconolactonase [Mariniphaga anaerophila]